MLVEFGFVQEVVLCLPGGEEGLRFGFDLADGDLQVVMIHFLQGAFTELLHEREVGFFVQSLHSRSFQGFQLFLQGVHQRIKLLLHAVLAPLKLLPLPLHRPHVDVDLFPAALRSDFPPQGKNVTSLRFLVQLSDQMLDVRLVGFTFNESAELLKV